MPNTPEPDHVIIGKEDWLFDVLKDHINAGGKFIAWSPVPLKTGHRIDILKSGKREEAQPFYVKCPSTKAEAIANMPKGLHLDVNGPKAEEFWYELSTD